MTNKISGDADDNGVDIVLAILDMVRAAAPTITAEQTSAIEQRVRIQFGGMRTRIAKRNKHPTQEKRAKVVSDFVSKPSDHAPGDVAQANGVSRRSLYNYLRRRTP